LSPAWAGITSLIGRPAFTNIPATPGTYIPKIVSNVASTPALNIQATAAFWRFIGEEWASAANMDFFQVVSIAQGANHIILDRYWVNGADTNQLKNGIQAGVRINSSPYIAVIDGTITNIGCINGNPTCSGDSQGVFLGGSACALDGPIKVTNNFIESAGENIFSGGGGCGTGTIPATDVEIAKNHFFKPLWMKANDPSYGGFSFRVKNSLEFKNTVRSLVEGNIFENVWSGQADQHGIAILFDSRNQNNSYSGVASASGNTLTWVSGVQFQSNITSPTCAPGGCIVTFNGVACVGTSFISVTQITVNCPSGGGGGITNNWVQVSTPSGATHIRDFAFNPSNNHWYLADRVSGFWISTNQGTSWTQINTGIASLVGWTITWDVTHSQLIASTTTNAVFYRSSNEGTTWTVIPQTNAGTSPAVTGSIISGNGNLIDGGLFGTGGTGGTFFSSNAGASTTTAVVPVNGTCPAPGGIWTLLWNQATSDAWLGTEQCGVYRSTNNGANWAPASPPDQNFTGGIFIGNVQGLTYDSSGNMLMSAQGGIWKAAGSNGTYTWTNVKSTGGAPNGRALGRDSTGCLYWGHSGTTPPDSVFRSCDGVTWNPFDAGLPTGLEGWKFLQNSADGQMYANLQNGSTNVGTIWRTISAGGSGQPPQVANAPYTAAVPGLNPSAAVTDVTFHYNYVRHATNGMQIANPPSDNGDLSALNARFSVDNNVFDDIDGIRWQIGTDCCNYGAWLQIQNTEGGAAQLDLISIWHNTALPTYSTGLSQSVAASFGFGAQTVAGAAIGHLRIYDNISAGGWWTGTTGQGCNLSASSPAQINWNCWTPAAQKCWDNNFMTTTTVPASGTGSFTHNNPAYPAPADNGYCPYGTAKGNTISAGSYTFPQFTNLNGANGGNYQLVGGSPWHNLASDGTDPGVNWSVFQQNQAGVQ
jgi:hypothetical protein